MYKSIHNYTRKLFFSPFEKLIHSGWACIARASSWMTHQGYLLRSLFSAALRRDATQTLWPHQLTTLYPTQRQTACQSPTSWNVSFSTLVGKNLKKTRRDAKIGTWEIRLMEEILHHLRWLKPYKQWDNHHPWWCRISSINSMAPSIRGLFSSLGLTRWWVHGPWKLPVSLLDFTPLEGGSDLDWINDQPKFG